MTMLSAAMVSTIRAKPFGAQNSVAVAIPAPTGGLNRRDVLSAMAPNDALTLDNWVPDINSISIRGGFVEWATGITGNYVETLMQYSPPSGTNVLFAAGPSAVWVVTAAGAATSSVGSKTNGRWSHVMFSNSTGSYLYCANGADKPMYYNGSTWTDSAFTGVTLENLDFVHSHLNRLWFIEKNSLNAWYAPTSAIAGALNPLYLGPFCKKGGSIVAIATWTRDGGTGGTDDYIVFITSNGEVVMYAGSDPTTFGGTVQIGVFKIAEPIGRRCFVRLGSDLAVITSQGLVSLVQTLPQTEGQRAASTITDKVLGGIREAHIQSGTLFGWQAFEYPKKNLLILNYPLDERAIQHQFVLNTRTGAWCKFTDVNAGCWSLLGDDAFFGGNDGKVYKFDEGHDDDGEPIVAIMQSSFQDYGVIGNKSFTMVRGLFLAPEGYSPEISVKVDYDTSLTDLVVINVTSDLPDWDDNFWDVALWGPAQVPSLPWQTLWGTGVVGSIAFSVSTNTAIAFNKADMVFEPGGIL